MRLGKRPANAETLPIDLGPQRQSPQAASILSDHCIQLTPFLKIRSSANKSPESLRNRKKGRLSDLALAFRLYQIRLMDSLARSLEAHVTEETAGKLAKFLSVEAGSAEKAGKILVSLALGSLAKKAATHEGAVIALASLPQEEEPGLITSLFSALKGEAPEETSADQMKALFGDGVNAMMAALSQRLGFDVGRLAAIVTPLMGRQLAKEARDQGLDASGFARKLQESWEAFLQDPAGAHADAETVAIVRETLAIGDEALALRARLQLTEAELEAIHLAPQAAYWLVAEASLSGIRGTIREMKAASQAAVELMKTVPPVSVMALVFGGNSGGAGLSSAEEEELLEDTRNEGDLLENIRAGAAVMAAKAPGEFELFCSLVREVARATAEASKEGGFLGVGGVVVSEKEKSAIALVEGALEG